jgi:2,3-bisphosphoglycerate-dependent phosphoglycerate mutase
VHVVPSERFPGNGTPARRRLDTPPVGCADVGTLVLLRHGQSQWNLENRFTGWWDVDLSARGEKEARAAGALLAEEGVAVDLAHTSVLTRAVRTLDLALEEMGRLWVPVIRHWRLNERHYGALTGLDKAETKAEYGEAQFMAWRRSYDIPPPPMPADHPLQVRDDPRYARLAPDIVPATECLADVVGRLLPYWYDAIGPAVLAGYTVLVAAHGNSLRALIKHLDGLSDGEITELEIPTGVPIVYTLDDGLAVTAKRELGDPEAIAAAADAVRRQGDHQP